MPTLWSVKLGEPTRMRVTLPCASPSPGLPPDLVRVVPARPAGAVPQIRDSDSRLAGSSRLASPDARCDHARLSPDPSVPAKPNLTGWTPGESAAKLPPPPPLGRMGGWGGHRGGVCALPPAASMLFARYPLPRRLGYAPSYPHACLWAWTPLAAAGRRAGAATPPGRIPAAALAPRGPLLPRMCLARRPSPFPLAAALPLAAPLTS